MLLEEIEFGSGIAFLRRFRNVHSMKIQKSPIRFPLLAALQDALCTDEEVAAWKRGEEFPDPWPKSIRRVE